MAPHKMWKVFFGHVHPVCISSSSICVKITVSKASQIKFYLEKSEVRMFVFLLFALVADTAALTPPHS